MARGNELDKMSYAELAGMETRIARLKSEKQNAERAELRQKVIDTVKAAGFTMEELFGKGGRWQGRQSGPQISRSRTRVLDRSGRMPRWMTAATRRGKAKEDFLI
jgi:DNA-binding protein H-NS